MENEYGADLFESLVEHDRAAFDKFTEIYRDCVVNTIYCITLDSKNTIKLAEKCFCDMYLGIEDYPFSELPSNLWVYRNAVKTAEAAMADGTARKNQRSHSNGVGRRMERFLGEQSSEDRTIIILSELEGLEINEIALVIDAENDEDNNALLELGKRLSVMRRGLAEALCGKPEADCCEEYKESLIAAAFGTVGIYFRRKFDEHMKHCPACAAELKRLVSAKEMLEYYEDFDIPESFADNINEVLDRLDEENASGGLLGGFKIPLIIGICFCLMIAAAVVGIRHWNRYAAVDTEPGEEIGAEAGINSAYDRIPYVDKLRQKTDIEAENYSAAEPRELVLLPTPLPSTEPAEEPADAPAEEQETPPETAEPEPPANTPAASKPAATPRAVRKAVQRQSGTAAVTITPKPFVSAEPQQQETEAPDGQASEEPAETVSPEPTQEESAAPAAETTPSVETVTEPTPQAE